MNSIFPARILLATDGSEEAVLAAGTASDLAQKTGSELHVVHVGETTVPPFYVRTRERARERSQPVLDEEVGRIEGFGGKVTEAHLRVGEPEKEIIALSRELEAGLVVLGAGGKGRVRRYLVGDVSEEVFRHAPCPVLTVRGPEPARPSSHPAAAHETP